MYENGTYILFVDGNIKVEVSDAPKESYGQRSPIGKPQLVKRPYSTGAKIYKCAKA